MHSNEHIVSDKEASCQQITLGNSRDGQTIASKARCSDFSESIWDSGSLIEALRAKSDGESCRAEAQPTAASISSIKQAAAEADKLAAFMASEKADKACDAIKRWCIAKLQEAELAEAAIADELNSEGVKAMLHAHDVHMLEAIAAMAGLKLSVSKAGRITKAWLDSWQHDSKRIDAACLTSDHVKRLHFKGFDKLERWLECKQLVEGKLKHTALAAAAVKEMLEHEAKKHADIVSVALSFIES